MKLQNRCDVVDRMETINEVVPSLRIVLNRWTDTWIVARQLEGYDLVFEDPIPKDNMEDYLKLKG